jgi:diguanylate cyclase (GGDEF)-like protein/PAS domain S-box-containing protein
VGQHAVEAETLDKWLDATLGQYPGALISAVSDDGYRIPVPPCKELSHFASIPLPPEPKTMADLVIPNDRAAVTFAWERAGRSGAAMTSVRLLDDPQQAFKLTLIDMRHRFGVWLATLTPGPEALRPRTATLRKDMFGVIKAIDERTARMLGWSPGEMVGSRSLEFVHPDDHPLVIANWMELVSGRHGRRVRLRHRCRDGTWLWLECENTCLDTDGPYPDRVEVVTQLYDISDEMAAHEAVRQRERLLHALAESLPIGLLQVSTEGSVIYANACLSSILGLEEGKTVGGLVTIGTGEDYPAVKAAFDAALSTGGDQELEVSVRRPDNGELRRCSVSIARLTAEEGEPGAVICVTDVTESARMRKELEHRATFDALTRCHNRASTLTALEQALTSGDARGTCVIFVDLDGFKAINDALGHAAGDELLVDVAQRLAGCVRAGDIVGRLGGDEFLVLCRQLGNAEQGLEVAGRIQRSLSEPFPLTSGTVRARASIGACYSAGSATADALVDQADAAMYESKRQGGGAPVLRTLGAPLPTTANAG